MIEPVSAPHPARDANKYTRGKLVVIAGSSRYPGAAVLAARASQRMGAGYTEVITASEAVDVVRLSSPSLVVRALDDWGFDELRESTGEKPCAVCIGPGFTGDSESKALVSSTLRRAACPVLVDGGGLSGLVEEGALQALAWRAGQGWATVLTPHAGEARRLAEPLGISADGPAALAADLARALGSIVVLKGPDTFVSDGSSALAMREGTPALAKAGTGDVLAGMISALLAQGIAPASAAYLGSLLHARAGAAAAARLTDIAVCAEDVIESICEVL